MNDPNYKFMHHILQMIPEKGWSWETIVLAEKSAGVEPGSAFLLFQKDLSKVIWMYGHYISHLMHLAYQKENSKDLKTHQRIELYLLSRFEVMNPYREAIQVIGTHLMRPQNALLSLKLMANTVDDIWYAAGDQATDWNYYTKRALLAGVYTSSYFYWCSLQQYDRQHMQGFIQRRLYDVSKIPKFKRKVMSFFNPTY